MSNGNRGIVLGVGLAVVGVLAAQSLREGPVVDPESPAAAAVENLQIVAQEPQQPPLTKAEEVDAALAKATFFEEVATAASPDDPDEVLNDWRDPYFGEGGSDEAAVSATVDDPEGDVVLPDPDSSVRVEDIDKEAGAGSLAALRESISSTSTSSSSTSSTSETRSTSSSSSSDDGITFAGTEDSAVAVSSDPDLGGIL